MRHDNTYSNEAEQSVLGGLLLDVRAWDRVDGVVAVNDFYRREHRVLFAAIAALYHDNQPVDILTVTDRLTKNQEIEVVGGLSYVAQLANNTPGVANIKAYAEVVRDRSLKRQALLILQDAADGVKAEGTPAITRTISALMGLFGNHGSYTCELHEAVLQALDDVEAIQKAGGQVGIPTGLKDLDAKFGGFHPSDLVVIGGRPGMGKTSKLLNFAWHGNVPAGIISAEQPSIQLGQRAMAMIGRVDGNKYRNASLDQDEFHRSIEAYKLIKQRQIYLYDRARPTLDEVFHQARRWKREHDIRFLGVDYIQRIVTPYGDTEQERIQDIVVGLKSIARELHLPVIALSAINREVEKRNDKRPTMADFKGSGAIEAEADVIIGLYRDEVYNNNSANVGKAELIFLKNRHGSIGYIECAWKEQFMVFEDL